MISGDKYYIDRTLDSKNTKVIIELELNFFELWFIIRDIPIYKVDEKIFEWKLSDGKNKYIIRQYKRNRRLLHIKTWSIYTDAGEKDSREFLDTILLYLECYNLYFRGIENNKFKSNDYYINKEYEKMKQDLMIWWCIIKEL